MPRWNGKHNWTPQEDEKLIALLDAGVRHFQLQPHFPHRTPAACKSRARTLRPAEDVGIASMKKAAAELRDAINGLIDRMPANDVAEMLGKPHLKIVERAPYKTQSALRELAA